MARIDITERVHSIRHHGDIAEILTWIWSDASDRDERAIVLLPWMRKGAPWFVVMEPAIATWDDTDPAMLPGVIGKSVTACDVLGIEPTPRNCRRVAGIIIDAAEDLIRMPSAPPLRQGGAIGRMVWRADGKEMGEQIVKPTVGGVSYG